MFIEQKKIDNKRFFDFRDTYVVYRTEDEASGLIKKIDYLDFPSKKSVLNTLKKCCFSCFSAVVFLEWVRFSIY